MFEYRDYISREMIQNEKDTLFVFGDNIIGKGFGGQARDMRGEPNSVGIPTKWAPDMDPQHFFYDFQYDAVLPYIMRRINILIKHPGKIVWPSAGIGTGLAKLDKTSPRTFAFIKKCEEGLRNDRSNMFYRAFQD